MRPQRALIMPGSACWAAKKEPYRLILSTRSQSACFIRMARPSRVMPALFTRTSMRPFSAITLAKPAFTASYEETSRSRVMAAPPAARISSATFALFSTSGDATTRNRPVRASVRAVSRPMPRLPPVTTATRSDILSPCHAVVLNFNHN